MTEDGQEPSTPDSFRWEDVREAESAMRGYLDWVCGDRIARIRADYETEIANLAQQLEQVYQRRALRVADGLQFRRHGLRGRVGPARPESTAVPAPSAPPAPLPPPGPGRRPAFSVVIPVYDNGSCLLDAVESVRSQTLPDHEIILWDDGSSDPATLAAFESLEGPGVRKFRAKNRGVVRARNLAAARAAGEFLIFLDPDDTLEPTYLEKALIAFTRYPDIDLVSPSTRVVGDGDDWVWRAGRFDERLLAYENIAPIATAFRRRVWETIGGMSDELDAGFEDWGFWRAVAARGFRGMVIDEPLFRYTFSEVSGRDSESRKRREELERRIKTMFPVVSHSIEPDSGVEASVAGQLASHVFHFPASGRHSLVIFVPWMLKGGGADNFLLSAIPELRGQFEVVVVATQDPPAGMETCAGDFLAATPFVYDLPTTVGVRDRRVLVESIMGRLVEPTILNVGSPYAYEHLSWIRDSSRGRSRVVDMQFNHVGHLAELLKDQDAIDLVLTAHNHLRALLEDYYEIRPEVATLYVGPGTGTPGEPSEREARRDGRPRIGWLGRNSPEKRVDLVLRMAAMVPEFDFMLAGGGLGRLKGDSAHLKNVDIVGWVDSSTDFLAGCDLILNTSDTEGVSLTAMEALQLGVPVVTRDVGGMCELVDDGRNGLVYDADDLGSLAERLRDRELIESIRARVAIERLPDRFSHEHMITRLTAALRRPKPTRSG